MRGQPTNVPQQSAVRSDRTCKHHSINPGPNPTPSSSTAEGPFFTLAAAQRFENKTWAHQSGASPQHETLNAYSMACISYQGRAGFAPEQMFLWKGQGPRDVTSRALVKAERKRLMLTGLAGDFPKLSCSKRSQIAGA